MIMARSKEPTHGFGRGPLTDAQKAMVEENLGLCYSMMDRFSEIPPDDWDECLSEGALQGLVEAVRVFDPAKGKFSTLACKAIRQRLWQRVMRVRKSRVGLHSDFEAILEMTPSGYNDNLDARPDAERLLARLSAKERLTIHLRYWDGLTFAKISKTMGCSVQCAKNRHDKAIIKMRRHGQE